jgi:hypothetical protein
MEERQMMADADYEEKALDWIEEITGIKKYNMFSRVGFAQVVKPRGC